MLRAAARDVGGALGCAQLAKVTRAGQGASGAAAARVCLRNRQAHGDRPKAAPAPDSSREPTKDARAQLCT
eukprot:3687735-Pyramimonas_sp.AAC.1